MGSRIALDDEGKWFEHIFRTVQRITSNVSGMNHRTTKRNCKIDSSSSFSLTGNNKRLHSNDFWHKNKTQATKMTWLEFSCFGKKGSDFFFLFAVARLAGRNELEPGRLPGVQYIREASGSGDGNGVLTYDRVRACVQRIPCMCVSLSLSLFMCITRLRESRFGGSSKHGNNNWYM